MDGKELISPSDLQSFYHHQQHQHQQQQQQQQQHRAALGGGGGGGGAHSPSSLAGMHSVVIRPMPNMPNMNMSATAILNSITGGPLAGMQFQMDTTPPPPLLHNSAMGSAVSGSASGTVPPAEPVKRKRGRPRKYGPDGTMKQAAAQQQQQHLVSAPPRMGSSMSAAEMLAGQGMEDPAQKKRRGRPPGTGKKQQTSPSLGNAFAGSAGTSFTPHIITASPSEVALTAFVSPFGSTRMSRRRSLPSRTSHHGRCASSQRWALCPGSTSAILETPPPCQGFTRRSLTRAPPSTRGSMRS